MTPPSATAASAPVASRLTRTGRSLGGFFFEPVPPARVTVLRIAIYLFVIFDLFFIVNDVIPHAGGRPDLYKPLLLRQWLHLPVPNLAYVHIEQVVIIVFCLLSVLCVLGRLPQRLLGVAGLVVAAAFTDWVSIGMSYAKIDHDHFAIITAVWVLPTAGLTQLRRRAAPGDGGPARPAVRSEAAGWALLCIQFGCVATYFLSACAKVRFGGWNWVTGSTFAWAMTRRGTALGRLLLDPSWILVLGQISVFTLECCSPLLLFLRGRWRYGLIAVFALFHLSTYLALTIHFLPLVVCLLAFLPLERLVSRRWDSTAAAA